MPQQFHKIRVSYPVTGTIENEQSFSFTTANEARAFRALATAQGYRIIFHSFDRLVSATDALAEINNDIVLTKDQMEEDSYLNDF